MSSVARPTASASNAPKGILKGVAGPARCRGGAACSAGADHHGGKLWLCGGADGVAKPLRCPSVVASNGAPERRQVACEGLPFRVVVRCRRAELADLPPDWRVSPWNPRADGCRP